MHMTVMSRVIWSADSNKKGANKPQSAEWQNYSKDSCEREWWKKPSGEKSYNPKDNTPVLL